MLNIQARQMFRSNGLIDDFVANNAPEDYLQFAESIQSVLSSKESEEIKTDSSLLIKTSLDEEADELFTSLQNEKNEYFSIKEWEERNILRVISSEAVLNELQRFLIELSGRGEGYSYLSEYSEEYKYSPFSPEWRLHVNFA